jgi:hypothetical protein
VERNIEETAKKKPGMASIATERCDDSKIAIQGMTISVFSAASALKMRTGIVAEGAEER